MTYPELAKALRRLKVETGSLACMGCGHEHNCSTQGCAILREAEELARCMSKHFNVETLRKMLGVPEWTPVSKALPDKYTDVLTRRSTGIDVEHYMGAGKWRNDCYNGHWAVTHWMPLPKAPVVHAYWIEDGDTQICSNCGEEHEWDTYRANFCDNCGAEMDGDGT